MNGYIVTNIYPAIRKAFPFQQNTLKVVVLTFSGSWKRHHRPRVVVFSQFSEK